MKNISFVKPKKTVHIPRDIINQKVQEFLLNGGKIEKIKDIRRNYEEIKGLPPIGDYTADNFLMS